MALRRHPLRFLSFLVSLLHIFPVSSASVSSSTPSPPLQWINLSGLLSGSKPPALKDASIGYDEITRTLIVFGGESQGGFPQSSTYLLNLDSLVWSPPSPPQGLTVAPAARSAAVSGGDFAANYRRGHVVIGGKGTNGSPLSDIWEFDYNNQYWTQVQVQPGGPSVFDAVGGIDTNVVFDPVDQNNTFYLTGGVQASDASPVSLSQTWKLQITGTLSPNLPKSVLASWDKQSIGNLPSVSGQGGTVILQKLVSYGGCANTGSPNVSCVTQNSYVIDTAVNQAISPDGCASPRLGAAVVPNRNTFTSSFNSQALVLLGLFNSSLWDDSGGLQSGEVDILDIGGGTWARILPSGDPSSGHQSFPSPRQGAAAYAHTTGLVGGSRPLYYDTIVYGGQDESGAYLDDVWLLRAYNGSVSSSGEHWSGFGNGALQSGINANGQGVSVQFLSTCATARATPSGPNSSTPPSSSSQGSAPTGSHVSNDFRHPFDTAVSHKILAPVSIFLALPAILLYRLSRPSANEESFRLRVLSYAIALAAYALGIVGVIFSFTTISENPSQSHLTRRAISSDLLLRTRHGQAGLVLFVLFYGALPVLYLLSTLRTFLGLDTPRAEDSVDREPSHHIRSGSVDTAEKLNGARSPVDGNHVTSDRSTATTPALESTPSPRRHLRSFTASNLLMNWRPTTDRRSSDSIALSEPSGRSFEVVNRPRKRHLSTTGTLTLSETSHRMGHAAAPRLSLSDVSWLDRRRSVNAISDLDYAISQQQHHRGPPTPATANLSTRALMNVDAPPVPSGPSMPPTGQVLLHIFMHALVLALCVLTLVALFDRGPRAAFAVFLAWTAAFYVLLLAFAWRGRPSDSALTVVLMRVRGNDGAGRYAAAAASTPVPSRPLSAVGVDFPGTDSRGPYMNSPAFRTAQEDEYYSPSRVDHHVDEAESDEDEDTRQRRIEEEMQRRDVSIVTVPKRRLWVVNPS